MDTDRTGDTPASAGWPALGSRSARIVAEAADWLLDATVLVFALWTVCCHITVIAHGTGTRLFVTAAGTFIVGAALLGAWALRRRATTPKTLTTTSAVASTPSEATSFVGLIGAIGVLVAWNRNLDSFWFWLNSMMFLLASTAWVLWNPIGREPGPPSSPPRVGQSALLWGLALVGATATALMNRPNSDDTLYVNFAVSLADHPEYRLFSRDTLHGQGMTLLRAYSAHSYELFAGALSWLTGKPALLIMHLWLAPFAGLLTAFAWGRLFRIIDPRRWLWLVAIVISWYVFDGTTDRSIAGHAFSRLFQGKAVLVTVAVPLISANATAFMLRPSLTRWTIFGASVISGIGLSSTGLWLAPLVGLTGLFVPLTFRWSFFKTAAFGCAALIYPAAFALWMRNSLSSDGVSLGWSMPVSIDAAAQAAHGLRPELGSFGGYTLARVYLSCLLLAWPLARTALARRYLLPFTMGGFAVLMNPFLIDLVAVNITGRATYSRVLWYMPFAAAFAFCFAGALPVAWHRLRTSGGVIVTCLALGYFYATYPKASALALVEFPPRIKVNRDGYAISKYLVRALDEQSKVLAPTAVSLVLPMLQHHPYAVMTKTKFFDDGGVARYRLSRAVTALGPPMIRWRRRRFVQSLQDYNVRGAVLTQAAERTEGMLETLEFAGFHRAKRFGDYRVWLRLPWSMDVSK